MTVPVVAYPYPVVVILGGIVGAIIALAVVVLPAEWINPDAVSETTEVIISVVVAAIGAFVGTRVTQRIVSR